MIFYCAAKEQVKKNGPMDSLSTGRPTGEDEHHHESSPDLLCR